MQKIYADGVNVVPEVWEVLDKIKDFTDKVRSWHSTCHVPEIDTVTKSSLHACMQRHAGYAVSLGYAAAIHCAHTSSDLQQGNDRKMPSPRGIATVQIHLADSVCTPY